MTEYKRVHMRLTADMFESIRKAAEGRCQTVTGYLTELHRHEVERVTGRPYRSGVATVKGGE